MDMKRILQAFDGAAEKPAKADSDMKRFVSIIAESSRPNNRLTQAESIAVNHYSNIVPRKDITSPVLNVDKNNQPSMIGKYFKSVEIEFAEAAERKKERSKQLAEVVSNNIKNKKNTP